MSQTSIIAGTLIIAFFVYITVRNELPVYLGILGLAGYDISASGCGSTGLANAVTTTVSTITGAQNGAPNYPGQVTV